MVATYPFTLILLAGLMAGVSAVLLRRASAILGRGLEVLALAAAVGAAAAFLWALYWAWTSAPAARPGTILESIAGWGLAVAGGLLAGWAVRARGWRPRTSWRAERDELRLPYRTIRRPIALGLSATLIGLAVLAARPAVWVCVAGILVAWNALLELADWEQSLRFPACRDYMRRTPRYLPGRGLRGAV